MTNIVYISGASNEAAKIAIPAHLPGDLLLMGVARAINGTITVPTGWTLIATSGVTGRYTIAYKIATASDTPSGNWVGSHGLMVNVYRGAKAVGSRSIAFTKSGTNIVWPARTLQVTDGSSLVVGVGYAGLTSTGLTAPAGRVSRINANFQSCWDTGVGVPAYESQTSLLTKSQPKYVATLELVAAL